MNTELASALIGAIIGSLLGSYGTWRVSRRLAYIERMQNQIENACAELQHYRVAYSQYYVEYLSAPARAQGRDWTSLNSDSRQLELEGRVDQSRGRLRVHTAVLRRVLPGIEGRRIDGAISQILRDSSHASQVDCRQVDRMCDDAMELLISGNRSHPGEPENLGHHAVMRFARTFERNKFQGIGQTPNNKICRAANSSGILIVRHFPTPCMPDP
jgi:hypothetical protein